MNNSKKKNIIEKIVIFSLALVVLGLLVFFLKDIFFPFIKLEISNDVDGAKEFLLSKGFLGYLTVSLVEGLQMIVIFIPAEFIQLSSGMSYPWYLAILLCDLGVIFGASIIYFIVHVFKFDGDIFHKQNKIEQYEKKMTQKGSKSSILLMYILFIMPIIPFGAICYYGSNKKIPYHKYILTCATGVIPSIGTSILMGTAIKEFITNSIPVWLLIIAIIAAAAILFLLLAFVLHHFFFKEKDGTPDSFMYSVLFSLAFTILKVLGYRKYTIIGKELLDEVNKREGSYFVFGDHHTFYDFASMYKLGKDRNNAFMINEFYLRIPIVGKNFTRCGMIPKKMYCADLKAIKGMVKAKQDGYPIYMFPEAQLSTDGSYNEFNLATAGLVKKFMIPLVLVQIRHGYFSKPKWRKKQFKVNTIVEVKRVIYPEEIETMSIEEIDKAIHDVICFNEFDYNDDLIIKNKNKAKGLENILYMCPECGEFYTNVSDNNTLKCSHCGATFEIDEHYNFKSDSIKNIHEYYERIKEIEYKTIDDINFDIEVDTRIYTDGVKKYKTDSGVFHLDKDKLSYKSNVSDINFEYKVKEVEGLPYSVNEEFEMYHNKDLYYFYPKENRKLCTRINLIYGLLKEREWNKRS